MKHIATVLLCCLVIMFVSIPTTHAQLDDGLSAIQACNCYYSKDCRIFGGDDRCKTAYPHCIDSGKFDGRCIENNLPSFNNIQLSLVANAIDLWFEAYQSPTKKRGLPNAEIVKRINKLELADAHQHRARFAVFEALDVALGFDFVHPRGDCQEYDERCLGIFRISIDPEGLELLQAVRIGFSRGLQKRNPQAVTDPIRSYWKQYPKYEPHHTGRCYPHGHPEYEFKSVADCQIDELSQILVGLLTPAKYK